MQSLPALSLSQFELPSQRSTAASLPAAYKGQRATALEVVTLDYEPVDAVSVEFLPAANDPLASGQMRNQAALQLYTSIARNHEPSPVSLHLIA